MTCRPNKEVPNDFKENRFKTSCYKCGRPMWFVKGKRKVGDKWEADWLIDEEIFTSQGLSFIFDEKDLIKITKEDNKFIHEEIKKYDDEQKKLWKPYMDAQKALEKNVEKGINDIMTGFDNIKSGLRLVYADKITNPVIDDLKIYLKKRLKEELDKNKDKVFEKVDKVLK